ncbi:hypothetical protein DFJ74DRAFT_655731 [Hyaloraphidium curvatum]|nr:hypothetical protein DFJ74DRAFT_655731 [Hyaloraphidium curvatum]
MLTPNAGGRTLSSSATAPPATAPPATASAGCTICHGIPLRRLRVLRREMRSIRAARAGSAGLCAVLFLLPLGAGGNPWAEAGIQWSWRNPGLTDCPGRGDVFRPAEVKVYLSNNLFWGDGNTPLGFPRSFENASCDGRPDGFFVKQMYYVRDIPILSPEGILGIENWVPERDLRDLRIHQQLDFRFGALDCNDDVLMTQDRLWNLSFILIEKSNCSTVPQFTCNASVNYASACGSLAASPLRLGAVIPPSNRPPRSTTTVPTLSITETRTMVHTVFHTETELSILISTITSVAISPTTVLSTLTSVSTQPTTITTSVTTISSVFVISPSPVPTTLTSVSPTTVLSTLTSVSTLLTTVTSPVTSFSTVFVISPSPVPTTLVSTLTSTSRVTSFVVSTSTKTVAKLTVQKTRTVTATKKITIAKTTIFKTVARAVRS